MSSESPTRNEFNFEESPLKEAYLLVGARTPMELLNLYTVEDQKLMKSYEWDYSNPKLVVNVIKEILESTDPEKLTEEEREWRQEILWFWYHHAVSCAIWKHKDKDAAKRFAKQALEYQTESHPNKITRLLDLLVNDKLSDAEVFGASIQEDPEKSTGAFLIEEYKKGRFFE